MSLRFRHLFNFLRKNDVRLSLSPNGIAYDAPQGVITAEIQAEMKRYMANLIAYLELKSSLEDGPIRNKLIRGDSEIVLTAIPDNSIDCIVTDPPYGYGFMGNGWDRGVPGTGIWNECLRVLKPGAFAFVMSAPRQDVLGRQLFSIEEAGFYIDFTPLFWAYASGFPKFSSISKAIDRKAGAVRKIIRRNPNSRENCSIANTIYQSGTVGKTAYITLPATEKAKELDGAYAGFQPKPAVEVIIVAMKPLQENTFTEQAESNGKGITWLDDCRIPYADADDQCAARVCRTQPDRHSAFTSIAGTYRPKGYKRKNENGDGRYPANLLVSDEVLGEQSKFFNLDAWENVRLPFILSPKASRREKETGLHQAPDKTVKDDDHSRKKKTPPNLRPEPRKNPHPAVKPLKLMSYLITMGSREGDIVLDPFCGTGTTCIAAMMLNRDYLGVEMSKEYHEIAERRLEYFRRKRAA